MKRILMGIMLLSGINASAQIGNPFIHDPSTIMKCDGKYYTFGTGEGGLISSDGYYWDKGAVRPGRGAAPDAVKIGDRYLVAYSSTGGGLGGGHAGKILTMWNKTLDPNSPDFQYSEPIEVAHSEFDEDCDAIDAGLLLDPTTGRLWCSYGTYFGYIRIVELDPKTGKRVEGNQAKNIAIDCEATDLIYRNGWYYLLGTHGTCCDGANSTYNIVVGRSRNVLGPYVDNVGRDMLEGGGKMVVNATERQNGPGHFGRYIEEDGVEKMSFHYEADLDRGGYSVLAIRPLIWKNDWPVCAPAFKEGTYEIESERRGYALELAVDFVRYNGPRLRFWELDTVLANQKLKEQSLDEVISTWPKGEINLRCSDYMNRPHQKWQITVAEGKGGYLGAPYFKIQIAGTSRTLTALDNKELIAKENYEGTDNQLWRIEQLTDGTYRIMPKKVGNKDEQMCLTSAGDSNVTLSKFDFSSDNCKWNFK